MTLGPFRFACALGRSGIKAIKREGDGASPRGRFAMRHVLFNPIAAHRPKTGLPVRCLNRGDGWCDASGDGNYNRAVRHPYRNSAEHLWRSDGLYDLIVVIGYNDLPRIQGRGSAIFMHVARAGCLPTEGCIALSRRDLATLLERLPSQCAIAIGK